MATSYTTSLKLALPTQGELTGTWGDTVNSQITSMIEEAVAGLKTINTWSGNSATLSTADGSTSEARAAILNLTDTGTSLSGAATVICPAVSKVYLVKNGTAQTVTVKTASGTGIAIPTGLSALVYCDGTNVLEGITSVAGNLAVGGNLTVTGTTTFNGGTVTLGDANTDNIVFGGEVDSNIIPDDDGTYDLGSSSKEWKDIYIDGVAYLDAINFNGTAISATAGEINILAGGTSATSTTVADADRVVLNDNGSMVQVAVTDLAAYFDDEITAMPNLVTTAATTVGALNSGSITSGFGNIDTGSSTITTTGLITGGSLDIDDVVIDGSTIGHTNDTDLITLANGVVTVAGEISVTTLDIGGDNVTSTANELSLLSGSNKSTSSITIADSDAFIIIDGTTTKQIPASDISTYVGSGITAVGALNSGSITSGFGSIDNGSSAITTTGTITYGSLSDGSITVTAFVDEDDMSSNSATLIPTQQSVKAYVDAQITAEDLDVSSDSGTIAIDLDSETLTFTGGTGIDTSATGNAVTFAIDSTVVTESSTDTLTNKTLTTPIVNNGIQLKNGATSAGFLEFFEDSDNGTNKLTLIGPASTADVTLTLPSATDTLVGKATTDTLTNKTLTTPIITEIDSGSTITLDATTDIILDADDGDIFFKDGGTTFGSATNNSGNLIIKSGTTTALTFSGADATLAGDLTISGNNLIMSDNTSGHLLIAGGSNFAPTAIEDLSSISSLDNADVFMVVDVTDNSLKKTTRSDIVAGLVTGNEIANVAEDTTPQLGGDLDVNGNAIVSASNGNIAITPNGSGVVRIDGSSGIDMQSGGISIKNSGAESYVRFYCEDNNQHYTQLQAAPHSAYSGSPTVVLPASADTLVGRATTDTLTNKTFGGNTSFGDNNITNVGDIALDSISADGTDINVAVSDNSSTAFTIKQGSDAYLIVDTGNSSESISIGTGVSGTAITLGHGTSEVTVADNLTVTGNLTVSGTTTTVNTTNTTISDNLLELNSGASSNSNDAGIIIQRGSTGNDALFMWDESADKFALGTTTDNASSTGNLNMTTGTLVANIEGNVTGNVTGNVSGTAATVTGAAQTNITSVGTLSALTVSGTAQFGSLSDGSITVTAFVDEDDMSSDSATLIPTQQSVKAYVDSQKADMQFVLEDGDGTEVQITKDKEVKFVEGGGIDINWTDTSTGSDGDPYDLTFTIDAAQTDITSIKNTSLVIGRDSDNDIDFATNNNIIFRAGGEDQVVLKDGVLEPVTDDDVDLGSSSKQFKNGFFDGTLEADTITVGGTALNTVIAGVTVSNATTAAVATTVTITDNENTNENNAVIFAAGADVDGGNLGLESDGNLTYNPSTGNLSATQLTGTIQTAAQTNITSVGTLAGLTVGATNGNQVLNVASHDLVDGGLQLAGTLVTASASELNILDGATVVVGEINALDLGSTAVGTAIASKAVILDSNKDYTGIRNFTITGELDADSLDIEGDADINGTTNLDVVDIDGAVDMASTLTVAGVVDITDTTDSSDATGDTGALRVEGGVSIAKKLFVGTDADIDGTTNLDVVDIDGAVSISATTTIGTTNKIQFRDTGLYINSSTDGQLDIVADTEVQIAATTIDINGNVDVSGDVTVGDDATVNGRAVGNQEDENDGTFDLSTGNFFICATGGSDVTLTFNNAAEGQAGIIKLVVTAGDSVEADGAVAINADVLTALQTAGTYMLSYYCTAASGNDTVLVGATGVLT